MARISPVPCVGNPKPPFSAAIHSSYMDSTNQSILETLRTVEFRLGLKGYNVDEVDEYLEKAAVEAESVLEQLRAVNERLRHANERVGQLEAELQRTPAERTSEPVGQVPDDALQRTLLLAQKFVDQTKRESETEAAEVVSRAEERARSLVAQAEDRARQIVTDSEQRVRDEVSRLETTRSRLSNEVETLTKNVEEQRTRIRESLTEALRWFDDHVPAGPARGPGAEHKPGPEAGRPQSPDRRQPLGGDQGSASQSAQSAQPGPGPAPQSASPTPATAGAASGASTSSARGEAAGATVGPRARAGGDLFGGGRRPD